MNIQGDGCTGGSYETLIVEWSSETECRAACEAKAQSLGEGGCCWHTPVQRNASSCEWITGGHHDVAGAPTIRSAVDCKGVTIAHRSLREVELRNRQQQDAAGQPRHCPAQDPGNCPAGISVSQRRKVAELVARTGASPPPSFEAMTSEQVDTWLAITFARWIAPNGDRSLLDSL